MTLLVPDALVRLAAAAPGTALTEGDVAAMRDILADHRRLLSDTARMKAEIAGLQSDLSLSHRRIALSRMRPRG